MNDYVVRMGPIVPVNMSDYRLLNKTFSVNGKNSPSLFHTLFK
jgi:hypothetical protein